MTTQRITDPDVLALATIGGLLEPDYPLDDEWFGSPFGWIKLRKSRQVGKIGEQLVAGYLAAKGFAVAPSPDSQADRIIANHRVEIKCSTRWKTGIYKFQQFRNQNYQFAVCLGISPFDAHCWAIPKMEILARWKARDGLVSQHGGTDGRDTAWLSFKVGDPPSWLSRYGGTLREGAEMIAQLVSK